MRVKKTQKNFWRTKMINLTKFEAYLRLLAFIIIGTEIPRFEFEITKILVQRFTITSDIQL